ncbi:eukaryotic membrane protein family-domain-containing protein [Corynascus similis CBS 632.67]
MESTNRQHTEKLSSANVVATDSHGGVPVWDTPNKIEQSNSKRRSRNGSRSTNLQLPSPILTPSDPPQKQVTDHNLPLERALSSPHIGVPTPDASSDSHSDGGPAPGFSSAEYITPAAISTRDTNSNATKTRSRSNTKTSNPDGVRRLSASKIQELTAAPESLPVAAIQDRAIGDAPLTAGIVEASRRLSRATEARPAQQGLDDLQGWERADVASSRTSQERPGMSGRTLSTPPMGRRRTIGQAASHQSPRRNSFRTAPPAALELGSQSNHAPTAADRTSGQSRAGATEPAPPSPIPPTIPLPPMSIPTLLQLELAGQRPSPLYIHHSYASDMPYESSAVKFERLKNFLLLPWYLERAMAFGAAACFDAWLWTFTVLPMRFCIAASVLVRWWAYVVGKEIRWLIGFVWHGVGRMWQRGRRGRESSNAGGQRHRPDESRSRSRARDISDSAAHVSGFASEASESMIGRPSHRRPSGASAGTLPKKQGTKQTGVFRHRRTKSSPSNLTSFHKADLLQGAILICSSIALMNLDASRMYHFIRAQSAIKLYAIYNLLEVGDRLLSALGQDIFECLFSTETLSRNSSGRSKVMLPLGMFLLALVYNILHSVILFYQVIALNVAVNSYSNALLTLLMSNQFVEIKSAVFKRFEKENTFQLACADIVERFQLWIMLIIIGMRNVVEVGGLSVPGAGSEDSGPSSIPLHTSSILPASFTILPSWLWSGEVLSPFIVVIGSEMVVDWIKHAYINKFNNIKPTFYSRILDILCKDYYTNAFVTPSLTRRLGLPLLPLSCLFIRASVQIYNMLLATHLPTPLPPTTQTSLSIDNATPSPAMLAGLDRLDHIIRNALGRSVLGYPYTTDQSENSTAEPFTGNGTTAGFFRLWNLPFTSDDAIAALTMVVVFMLLFLILLVVKLVLGMALLRYARDRYARMKVKEQAIAAGQAERESFDAKGKRVGGYGQVEVGDERRRWIFGEDVEGLRKAREKERKAEEKTEREKDKDFSRVMRYEMVARRIW